MAKKQYDENFDPELTTFMFDETLMSETVVEDETQDEPDVEVEEVEVPVADVPPVVAGEKGVTYIRLSNGALKPL